LESGRARLCLGLLAVGVATIAALLVVVPAQPSADSVWFDDVEVTASPVGGF
jgi:hypothetical protein